MIYNDADGKRAIANRVKNDVRKELIVKEGDEFAYVPDNWFTVNVTMHKSKMWVYLGSADK